MKKCKWTFKAIVSFYFTNGYSTLQSVASETVTDELNKLATIRGAELKIFQKMDGQQIKDTAVQDRVAVMNPFFPTCLISTR
jgi:hypothetical protein